MLKLPALPKFLTRALVALGAAFLAATPLQAADQPTALITGANRGIGLEFVRQLSDRGYKVIATARDTTKAEELKALAKDKPNIVVENLDVTDHAGVDALAAKYKDQPIDLLISNAAITPRLQTAYTGKVEKLDYDVARRSFETNALGAIKLAATFMPNVEASTGKKMIFISSKAGSFGEGPAGPIMFEYRASKAALNMLVHTLSFQTKNKGIAAVLLSPGTVSTEPAPGEFGYGMNIRQPNAITPEQSVSNMLKVIDGITKEHNGKFLDHSDGHVVAF
jgi:NAD(P)-dependent dehydrogenase (short-subunit alcohol dehydrogenase family)